MATIRDVARHAHVSVATVSRVINGSGIVSDELRQRVQKSIAALGFEPDFLAQSWRTRLTRTVAAVISDNTSPHHGIILREAAALALAHNHSLILCTTFNDAETERRYLRMLRLRHVDGVLLNTVDGSPNEVRALTDLGVPVVMLNRPRDGYGPMVDAVIVDSRRGSCALVDHLIRLGHRRIGLLFGNLHEFHRRERLQGYRDALQAHGLDYDEDLVRQLRPGHADNSHPVIDLLSLSPPPSAVFAAGYSTGLSTLTALRAAGVRIPEDIAFTMYDDVPWGAFVDPPLTLVQNPGEEVGRVAMELILARLADRTRPPQEGRIHPRLVGRRSCGWTGPVGAAATERAEDPRT